MSHTAAPPELHLPDLPEVEVSLGAPLPVHAPRARGLRVRTRELLGAYLPLMLMATRDNSAAQQIGDEYGVTMWFEAFADRAYDSAGKLVSRQLPGAVHHDPEKIIEQALTIARGDNLSASDGSALRLHANTLCVHGDNASSVAAVQRIREALNQQSAS